MPIAISSKLVPGQGAHPTIVSSLTLPDENPASCSTYLYYSFPPLLFVDAHELALRSHQYSVVGLRGRGSRELERPVHALPHQDPALVEVVLRLPALNETGNIEVELPIHVRYAEPLGNEQYLNQVVSPPRVFVLCEKSMNDCANVPLYISAISSQPCYAASPMKLDSIPMEIRVPVGDRSTDLATVELGTAVVILACFFWVLSASWKTYHRLNSPGKGKDKRDA